MLEKIKEIIGQRKIASFFVLLLIATAIPLTVFIAEAAEKEAISFRNVDGTALPLNSNNIPQTTSPTFQVELNSTLGTPVFASPTPSPTPTPSPSLTPIPGSIYFIDGNRNPITSTDSPTATVTFSAISPDWSQYGSLSGVTTKTITVAEDSTYTLNRKTFDFVTPNIFSYTFSSVNPGTKTLYAQFYASDFTSVNAIPFPVTIELTGAIRVTVDFVNKTMVAGQKTTIFQIIDKNHGCSGVGLFPINSTQDIKVDTKLASSTGDFIFDVILSTNTSLATGTYSGTINVSNTCSHQVINIPLTVIIPTPTYKRVFVTSSGYSGDFKSAGSSVGLGTATSGLDGADKICQSKANAANLGGSWKAWLSDSSLSAANRLSHSSIFYNGGRIVNGVDNPGKIAENWAGLTRGSDLLGPIGYDEYCLSGDSSLNNQKCHVWPGAAVWTNTTVDGSISNKGDCNGWTSSASSLLGGAGVAGYKTSVWTNPPQSTNPSTWSCNTPVRLYCFEQDSSILGVAIATTQISGTVSYKIADRLTDLDNAVEVPYTSDQLVFNYTLSSNNQTPGIKTIFVEFKNVAGQTDIQTAQIELVSPSTPTPAPVCNACSADVNKNGKVSVVDYSLMVSCYDQQGVGRCLNADINKTGTIDIEDIGCVINHFGQTCSQ